MYDKFIIYSEDQRPLEFSLITLPTSVLFPAADTRRVVLLGCGGPAWEFSLGSEMPRLRDVTNIFHRTRIQSGTYDSCSWDHWSASTIQ